MNPRRLEARMQSFSSEHINKQRGRVNTELIKAGMALARIDIIGFVRFTLKVVEKAGGRRVRVEDPSPSDVRNYIDSQRGIGRTQALLNYDQMLAREQRRRVQVGG